MIEKRIRRATFWTWVCLIPLATFGCASGGGAAGAGSELDFLVGTWSGVLEYLDYGDNQTRVELPTETTYRRDGSGLAYTTVFTEPNGSKITDEGRLARLTGNRFRVGNDVYDIAEKASNGSSWRLTTRGTDNDRPAEFRLLIERRGDALVLRKEVIIDGTEEPFVRNELRLTRRRD
ncbi:MAG: hypothetical protein AAF604_17670 [Acidobacteriota bacterium]